MFDLRTFALRGKLAPVGQVEFLSVDISVSPALPFAIVEYALGGIPQPLGLRLDMDKRIVLDTLASPLLQEEVTVMTERLLHFLATDEAQKELRAAEGVLLGAGFREGPGQVRTAASN